MTKLYDVLDAAVAGLTDLPEPLPAVPCPPAKFLREGHWRRREITGRLMLKIIALRAVAVGCESSVLMIVEAFIRIGHRAPVLAAHPTASTAAMQRSDAP